LDLAKKIVKMINSTSAIVKVPYTSAYPEGYEDMQRRVPNISKLSSFTGWQPNFSLDEAILSILENN
jgi:UDP-glucose 4-epimerase